MNMNRLILSIALASILVILVFPDVAECQKNPNPLIIFPSVDTVLHPSGPIQFHWSSWGPNFTYKISLPDGTIDTYDTTFLFQNWQPGHSYEWNLIVVDLNGPYSETFQGLSFSIASSGIVQFSPYSNEVVFASPNPVTSGTVIYFTTCKEAFVKINLFDVLGQEVTSYGFESLFEPGNKSVPISLAGLAPGTYYARILAAYGEVQTVKLVKE